jgi:endonuclease/exonuclease/phosphatase family metal-dependent hydrolase
MNVNVASWNIWIYGSRDYKEIAKVARENKIDIIGIQEAGVCFDKNPPENTAEKIAKELDFHFVYYPAFDRRPNRPWLIGNAILSKFPIIKSEFYQLNPSNIEYDGTAKTEPRILVSSKIKLNNNKMLNFLTTHLQFSLGFKTTDIRIAQVERILSVIKKLGNPIVLTGDFNAIPESEETRKIEKFLIRIDGNEPTWTVYPWNLYGWHVEGLEYRIDNIFISKDLIYKSFKIIKSKVSDHLPIKATITI